MKLQEMYKNNVRNFVLNFKDFYFISVNFSKTRYLNLFLGHMDTDEIFEYFYNKIIKQKNGIKYTFFQFDWIYIFFDKKNYSYEDIKNEIKQIIRAYENMIDLLYGNYNLKEEIKKEKYNFKKYEIPLIQMIVNEGTNELLIEKGNKLEKIYSKEEIERENKENNELFKKTFFSKYDQLYYSLKSIKNQNFIFNFVEDKYEKIKF